MNASLKECPSSAQDAHMFLSLQKPQADEMAHTRRRKLHHLLFGIPRDLQHTLVNAPPFVFTISNRVFNTLVAEKFFWSAFLVSLSSKLMKRAHASRRLDLCIDTKAARKARHLVEKHRVVLLEMYKTLSPS